MAIVRPEFLNAIIQAESGGNHKAVSKKGARGLTQIMPATAKDPGFGVTPLQNGTQEEAKRFTTDYLGKMLDRYNGDEGMAAAAYNAGPGAVDAHKGIPPYPETQSYVSKVLGMLNPISTANASEQPYNNFDEFYNKYSPKKEDISINDSNKKNIENNSSFDEFYNKYAPKEHNALGLSSVGKAAMSFVPDLATNVIPGAIKGIYNQLNPFDDINPLQNGLNAANGYMQKMLPDSINQFMPESTRGNKEIADQVTQGVKGAYGSGQAIKNRFEQHPAQMLSDLSALGGVAGGIGKLAKIGGAEKLLSASNAINPVSMAGNATSSATKFIAPKVGNILANAISAVGTHTGAEGLKEATKAGMNGGKDLEDVTNNLRGNVPLTDVVEIAKSKISDMVKVKQLEYKNSIAPISNDRTVLDMNPIKTEIDKSINAISFNGIPKNESAYKALSVIKDEVTSWEARQPNLFHTPMGLDALKQRVWALKEQIPMNERTAQKFAGNIYNSIKDSIVRQAHDYSKVMKNYEEASDQIDELSHMLSIKDKAHADTILRKLQKTMRNNANTNYGNNLNAVQSLESLGGQRILPSLAGQSLSSIQPRSLGGLAAAGIGGYGLATMNPMVIPALAIQSPRLMGESALLIGKGAAKAKKLAEMSNKYKGGTVFNSAYQADKIGNKNAKR